MPTPIIVLAAGNSSRLGQAKQLLPRGEQRLLQYVVQQCLATKLGEVLVVLGAEAEKMRAEINELNCMILVNENWSSGQGSSIACAAESLDETFVDGVYIVLVDQVHFSKEVLLKLDKERKKSKSEIVLSKYQEGAGPPSFFSAVYLKDLQKLNSEVGAKPIVQANKDEVVYVPFPLGHLDIDLPDDLNRLKDF